jgi:hypothetical protein
LSGGAPLSWTGTSPGSPEGGGRPAGHQRSGLFARESAVRQTRQCPQLTMGRGELGAPHSGQSTSSGERASLIPVDRSWWTVSLPPQVQPRWWCVQCAASMAMASLLVVAINATQPHQPPGRVRRCRASRGYRGRVLRWLSALVAASVLSGFAFLLVTGEYINDGQVVVFLIDEHGIHEGDLFVLAGWTVSLLALALLLGAPRPRDCS